MGTARDYALDEFEARVEDGTFETILYAEEQSAYCGTCGFIDVYAEDFEGPCPLCGDKDCGSLNVVLMRGL